MTNRNPQGSVIRLCLNAESNRVLEVVFVKTEISAGATG